MRILFLLPALLQGILVLLTIPALVGAVGAEAWGQIAVAQAIGAVAAVVVSLGWGVTGPSSVARRRTKLGQAMTLKSASAGRMLVVFPIAIVGGIATASAFRGIGALAALGFLGVALLGLSNTWFFVGANSPVAYLMLETLPRVTFSGAGLVAIWGFREPLVGLFLIMTGPVVAFVATYIVVVRSHGLRVRLYSARRERLTATAKQLHGLTLQLAQAVTTQAPIILLAAANPQVLPLFAAVDKLQKQLITAAVPIGSLPLSKLRNIEYREARTQATAARGYWILVAIAVAGAIVVAGVSPTLIWWLTVGHITLTTTMAALVGVVVSMTFLTVLVPPMCLAPRNRIQYASWGGLAALVMLFTLVWPASVLLGAVGAQLSMVASLGVSLVYQTVGVMRR